MMVKFLSIYSVFFFKQKTAYEFVSRDWSSDVCSSDLRNGQYKKRGCCRNEKWAG